MPTLGKVLLLVGSLLPVVSVAQIPYPASRTRRSIPGTPNPGAYKDVAGSFHGKLKDLSNKEIMIETDDNQIVSIRRIRKTKFLKGTQPIKASDIEIETPVTVDVSEDIDLKPTALNVVVDTPKKNADGK